jgi:hypothetical protein
MLCTPFLPSLCLYNTLDDGTAKCNISCPPPSSPALNWNNFFHTLFHEIQYVLTLEEHITKDRECLRCFPGLYYSLDKEQMHTIWMLQGFIFRKGNIQPVATILCSKCRMSWCIILLKERGFLTLSRVGPCSSLSNL